MAYVEPSLPFDHFRGRLSSSERIIMRTRNGKTHAYAVKNPYKGPISENRKPIISAFSQAVSQCKTEMTDPERLAYWQDRYNQYCKQAGRNPSRANIRFVGSSSPKFYTTLRGFIIASLSAQLRASE